MANRLAKYNPDLVVITVGGVIIQGFADGEFITVEPITPAFQEETGTDGEVALSPSNDRRLKVVIKLIQTSVSNAYLSSLLNESINDPTIPTFEFNMEDTLGGSVAHGAEAWIVSFPSRSYDRTAKSREWEIHVASGTQDDVGN